MPAITTVAIYLGASPRDGGTFQNELSLASALAMLPAERYRIIGYAVQDEWAGRLDELGIRCERVGRQGVLSRAATWLVRRLPFAEPVRKRLHSVLVPFGRQLERDDVDVCLYPNFEHYAWELGTASIGQIHDLMHRYEPHFPEVSEGDIPQERDRLFSRMRRGATAVLVDSELGVRQVEESYGTTGARLFALPYIPPNYIYEAAEQPDLDPDLVRWAQDAGIPDKFLFYPAQTWIHKNHERLLEALAWLRKEYPDAVLVLAGSEKNGAKLVTHAIRRLGVEDAVHMLGYVEDQRIAHLYKTAAALIYPSFFGPTNIPPLEAFVLGCPVAVSDVYAMRKQVGEAALLFDPSSVEQIFEACSRLWADDKLRMQLRERGYAQAARWGREQFAERLRSIIDEVVGGVDTR